MNMYLYRVLEVDEELDPVDFGVLRAPDVDAAFAKITERLQSLRDAACVMPVRLYPIAESPCGMFEDAGDYIDRDVVLPNRLKLEEIIARYDLNFLIQEELISAMKPVGKDDQGESLYSEDEVDEWLKLIAPD